MDCRSGDIERPLQLRTSSRQKSFLAGLNIEEIQGILFPPDSREIDTLFHHRQALPVQHRMAGNKEFCLASGKTPLPQARLTKPDLTSGEIRRIIIETAYDAEGFRVLDAEAVVKEALEKKVLGL